jgi:hypothetical protein
VLFVVTLKRERNDRRRIATSDVVNVQTCWHGRVDLNHDRTVLETGTLPLCYARLHSVESWHLHGDSNHDISVHNGTLCR